MTATAESPAPARPATLPAGRPPAFPLPPEATIVGGLFSSVEGPQKVMRAMRSKGTAGDAVGLAVPLPGHPDDPQTLAKLADQRPRKRFDLVGYLKAVVDPHSPPAEFRALIAGQNAPMTRLLLSDLANWISGVKTFRIPPSEVGDVSKEATQGGVWVLGRSNHAAAVAGLDGAEMGGYLGALAGIGVQAPLAQVIAERIAGGEVLLTACETDAGRAARDKKWMRKFGGADLFEWVVVSPRRSWDQG
ncbi:MAG TPA: hypothetical protein VH257_06715 [Chloroflexota bacterium]|nr:hypothetical protein [Chloroflexota bacterium]